MSRWVDEAGKDAEEQAQRERNAKVRLASAKAQLTRLPSDVSASAALAATRTSQLLKAKSERSRRSSAASEISQAQSDRSDHFTITHKAAIELVQLVQDSVATIDAREKQCKQKVHTTITEAYDTLQNSRHSYDDACKQLQGVYTEIERVHEEVEKAKQSRDAAQADLEHERARTQSLQESEEWFANREAALAYRCENAKAKRRRLSCRIRQLRNALAYNLPPDEPTAQPATSHSTHQAECQACLQQEQEQ